MSGGEYEFEPIRGLPALLPPGERMLWQGGPDWRALALRVFHVRKIAIYFALLAAWRAAVTGYDGGSLEAAAMSVLWMGLLAAVSLTILTSIAWLIGRTTVYTITNKRLVLRFGIALPMSVNLPFKRIESAAMKAHGDGTGEIPVTLTGGDRTSYLVMWPHVRPWRFSKPQPMLRAVPDAAKVAGILSEALAGAAGLPKQAVVSDEPSAVWPEAQGYPAASAAS